MPLTGSDPSIVRAASSDGRRVLGARVFMPGAPGAPPPPGPPGAGVSYAPFVWDAADGAQDLAGLLEASGADLTGLTLGDPIAMSADGGTVVGHATCGADTVIFRAVLAPGRRSTRARAGARPLRAPAVSVRATARRTGRRRPA